MKTKVALLASAFVSLTLLTASAQPPNMRGGAMGGGPSMGPRFDGVMAKILEKNPAFSADLEFHTTGGPGGADITMPGKVEYLDGKSRFEMDMSQAQGVSIPAPAIAKMKEMGMDKMIVISRPDLKLAYMVYPGMSAYMENPMQDAQASAAASDYKVDITKIGNDTVDGHACVKNKVVVTDKDAHAHESTVWTATDLKEFPIKIEATEGESTVTMLYKNIKTDKPAAADFNPPTDSKKYNSMMDMMMSRASGGR